MGVFHEMDAEHFPLSPVSPRVSKHALNSQLLARFLFMYSKTLSCEFHLTGFIGEGWQGGHKLNLFVCEDLNSDLVALYVLVV